MLWNQLQQGQKPPKPVTAERINSHDNKPRPTIRPPFPHVNGHLLSLAPSWLKQGAGIPSTTAKSEASSAQNLSENPNPVTSQKPTKVSIYMSSLVLVVITAVNRVHVSKKMFF